MARTRMVRKQVYIEPRQEKLLKTRARDWGVPEAELIRLAIDRLEEGPPPASVRRRAWEQIDEYIREHRMMDVPQTGRQWTREDLYQERFARRTRR